MPDLVRQIGEPERSVQLRQGVLQSTPSGGTASVIVGGATGGSTIAGVRVLDANGLISGDPVFMLQQGYDLLILGKVGATNPARMGASPAGAYGSAYASWDHTGRAWTTTGNYVLLANAAGDTYINATTGGAVYTRVNNVDQLKSWAGGFAVYTNGTEAAVIDTNTGRFNYGVTINYNTNLFLRGYNDTNHRLLVPTIGSFYSTAWNQDGPALIGFAQVLFCTSTVWRALVDTAGMVIRDKLGVGGGSTNDGLRAFECIATYGGASGIAVYQRTRAWNDAAANVVLYATSDEARIYHQTKGDVIQYQANGILRVQGWLSDGNWVNAGIRLEDASTNHSASIAQHCPSRCATNIELWPGSGQTYWYNSSVGWQVLNVDVVDQSREASKRDLRDLGPTRAKVKRVKAKVYKRLRPDDPAHPHHDRLGHHHAAWREQVENGVWDADLAAYQDQEWQRDHIGFTAEDMAAEFPEVVNFLPDGTPDGIRYRLLTAVLWQMNQEQDDMIESLAARLAVLERKGK